MIESILGGEYRGVTLHHVRMDFSARIEDVGKLRPTKVWRLIGVILRIVKARLATRAAVLYFPPAAGGRVPLYRDFAVLIATRWMFRATIFHFHASGVMDIFNSLRAWEKGLFRAAYFRPAIGIRAASNVPDDPLALKARHNVVVQYGVPDDSVDQGATRKKDPPSILFVGAVRESKGVLDLIEAVRLLRALDVQFSVEIVGGLQETGIETRLQSLISANDLSNHVYLRGVLTGSDKHKIYAEASLFCFPSFYESEALPVALIEAMQFGLPVVATRWRGIPDLIDDGTNGFLVSPRDVQGLAQALKRLLEDRDLRMQFGELSRQRYEREFTIHAYRARMQSVFDLARAEVRKESRT